MGKVMVSYELLQTVAERVLGTNIPDDWAINNISKLELSKNNKEGMISLLEIRLRLFKATGKNHNPIVDC
jgi:hypothetical protein